VSGATVSVIMPARDAERYVGEALRSILEQTRPPDQVIVVDDGSGDGTAEVVETYRERVTLLRRDHGGVGAAINSGLVAADGELIAFLDADDLWTPRKLEVQCAALADNPQIDMVFGRVQQFLSPDLTPEEKARLQAPGEAAPAKLKGTMLASRTAVERVGDFATSWKIVDFLDWYFRAREEGLREEMLDEVILRRRLHRANIGRLYRDSRNEYAQALAIRLRRRRGPRTAEP
jgi:glycosyltransferase involved in cell wall biosynthesis